MVPGLLPASALLKRVDMASYRGVACHIKLEITGYHWLIAMHKPA